MDGHFVPNLSMGALRVTRLSLDAHLMISNPDFFLDEFVEAGADSSSLHWEGNNDLSRTVQRIKALGRRVGVVINPATPAAVLEEILQDVDQVLVMTVNPGFGHQLFLHTTLLKIQRVRQMIDQIKPGCDLEVDGGHRCDDRSAGGCCRRQRSGGRIGDFWRQRSSTRRHDTAASSTAMSNRYKGSNICSSE
jgi:ribulose-phosphate 3-epimerase